MSTATIHYNRPDGDYGAWGLHLWDDGLVKDTDSDRYFVPLATPEIWLRAGDARIFTWPAADASCVVPSA